MRTYKDTHTHTLPTNSQPTLNTPTSNNTMPASGPSYNAMATSAILAMKDRTGSSVMAITKWVQTEYPNLAFKKHLLGAALKKGAASGAFVKVKASYKVSMDEKKKIAAERRGAMRPARYR